MALADEFVKTTERYRDQLETATANLHSRTIWAISQRIKELTEHLAKLGYSYQKPKKDPPGQGKGKGKGKKK